MSTILAFDFEAILDAAAGRRVFGLTGTDTEVRRAMEARRLEETTGKDSFERPAFWQIVAIGAVAIDPKVGRVKLLANSGLDERALIAPFNGWLEKRPILVTFNGRGYDLPVLRYRAMLHAVDLGRLYGAANQKNYETYDFRFGDWHIDLMDLLSGFGASKVLKLSEMARFYGLPAKTITDGSGVEDLVAMEAWPALQSYVLEDALDTALLFLRLQLSRGRITRADFDALLRAINGELSMDHIEVSTAITAWLAESKPAPAAPVQPEFGELGLAGVP